MMRSVMVFALGLASCACAETDVYVAADAAAGGDGGKRKPYQTLTQARDGIRAARKAGTLKSGDAVTVQVGAGVYRQEASFELTAEDGGTAVLPAKAGPGDWPAFRGPARDNRVPGGKLSTDWSAPPRELWRKRIGLGWSS